MYLRIRKPGSGEKNLAHFASDITITFDLCLTYAPLNNYYMYTSPSSVYRAYYKSARLDSGDLFSQIISKIPRTVSPLWPSVAASTVF